MRAVWMTKHGGVDALEVRETPDPRATPHVDSTFPFADVAAAHRRMEARENVGKVMLRP